MEKNMSEMELTDEEFDEIVNNSHKLVVIDFYAEWCMPCIMLAPVIDDLAECMKDIRFAKVNIEDNEDLARKYKVSTVPCLVVFKDGKEAGRIIGTHSAEVIEKKIREYLY